MSSDESVIHHAVDFAVFGPLGLALAARDALPEWVAEGRSRAVEQFVMAKTVGEMVTDYGQKKVTDTLVALGVLPGPPPPVADPVTHTVDEGRVEPDAPASTGAPPRRSTTANDIAMVSTAAGPSRGSDDLAIPGYDSLSASQVVSRLAGLAAGELEAVRAYEAASRGRRTILTKVAQLQAGRS